MAQAAQAQQPRMGLAGMRAPTSSARALAPSAPTPVVKAVKQVKAPVVAPAAPVQPPVSSVEPEAGLPSTVVPLEPATDEVETDSSTSPPTVEPTVSEDDNTLPTPVQTSEVTMDAVLEDADDDLAEADMEAMLGEQVDVAPDAVLPTPVAVPVKPGGEVFGDRPILQPVRTLHALGTPRPTAVLKSSMPVLPAAEGTPVLQPVTTMTPRELTPVERLEPSEED